MSDKIKERYRRKKISENTKKSQTTALLWLSDYRKKIPFKDLNKKFIEGFESWMQKQNNKRTKEKKKLDGNTIANVMKYVKAYINLAIDDHIPIENPFVKADVKTVQDVKMIEHLRPRDVAKLIKYYRQEIPIGEKLTLCRFLIACHLSLRISDILKPNESKLEYYKAVGKLIFHPQKQELTKKLKTVYVHIDEYAMKYMEDCVELQIEAIKRGLKISEPYGRKALKTISNKLGMEIAGFHMGRHTFATNYIRFGGKVTNLQYIMGHSNINTTMRYVHIVEEDTDEDMISLSRGYLAFMNTKKEPVK
ncbi:site-specific integrase [Dyadobacter sp. LHD-138]|uniref:tyrosine-type recombinase/integrase n=1 Tax=Dyadobacter sp. LHD-138 TaxID=3071413 RepID=UPI0027DF57D3|nr:site-specific integrase [Dyadobacter sp. LHD-138]MDQ6479543.1 site-specific integrase [Dyadobacter sp. LHD-138]